MLLPNADRAFIDLRKLRDYCLNVNHPRGRHKARTFRAGLGLTDRDAEQLKELLLTNLGVSQAYESGTDAYAVRYTVDVALVTANHTAEVRTVWIVRNGEDFPRLLTCYVL